MTDKQNKEGRQGMVTTSLRLEPELLEQLRTKSKPASPSAYLRILARMWVDDRIIITDEDIQKYA